LDDPIFLDALGGFRDPNNVRKDLRLARQPIGGSSDVTWAGRWQGSQGCWPQTGRSRGAFGMVEEPAQSHRNRTGAGGRGRCSGAGGCLPDVSLVSSGVARPGQVGWQTIDRRRTVVGYLPQLPQDNGDDSGRGGANGTAGSRPARSVAPVHDSGCLLCPKGPESGGRSCFGQGDAAEPGSPKPWGKPWVGGFWFMKPQAYALVREPTRGLEPLTTAF
jgi:hypothetical protein